MVDGESNTSLLPFVMNGLWETFDIFEHPTECLLVGKLGRRRLVIRDRFQEKILCHWSDACTHLGSCDNLVGLRRHQVNDLSDFTSGAAAYFHSFVAVDDGVEPLFLQDQDGRHFFWEEGGCVTDATEEETAVCLGSIFETELNDVTFETVHTTHVSYTSSTLLE